MKSSQAALNSGCINKTTYIPSYLTKPSALGREFQLCLGLFHGISRQPPFILRDSEVFPNLQPLVFPVKGIFHNASVPIPSKEVFAWRTRRQGDNEPSRI
jgi:hypothetical protein